MTGQPDLFDLSPKPSPVVDRSIETVHWIVVTTKRARTGCGIIASSYDMSTHIAVCENGAELSCSLDVYSDKVTCRACKEAI